MAFIQNNFSNYSVSQLCSALKFPKSTYCDLGSQYTDPAFEDCLSRKGLLHSYSRKGNPYGNACIESFHSVLKKEEIYLHTYQASKETHRAIFEYVEGWWIHSSIGI